MSQDKDNTETFQRDPSSVASQDITGSTHGCSSLSDWYSTRSRNGRQETLTLQIARETLGIVDHATRGKTVGMLLLQGSWTAQRLQVEWKGLSGQTHSRLYGWTHRARGHERFRTVGKYCQKRWEWKNLSLSLSFSFFLFLCARTQRHRNTHIYRHTYIFTYLTDSPSDFRPRTGA